MAHTIDFLIHSMPPLIHEVTYYPLICPSNNDTILPLARVTLPLQALQLEHLYWVLEYNTVFPTYPPYVRRQELQHSASVRQKAIIIQPMGGTWFPKRTNTM